ncbi:hypothetical protein [uncultured Clostridium sp.]|uniref:hypothetical protein n=1 Tax=uncultured Clostridium sp. TaxID=59620 RepID=UPI0025F3EB4C|nr:hypothetical protein [uncultured Clostridium sp.]
MKINKSVIILIALIVLVTPLSGCSLVNDVAVKLNFRNEKFDYIKQNKVDKIVIQNVRDSGFRFIVNDTQAINDIYKILARGKECAEKSSLDPDYIFEVYIGEDVKKYSYVVGQNSNRIGNFYDEENAFSVPKNLENTIMQNLSFIRKPRSFEYIYYESILKIVESHKDVLSKGKVGIDISGDVDCLKYVFSSDLEDFKKNLSKLLPDVDLVNNNSNSFDTIIKVKNRGYNSTTFKTLITVDNKLDKSFESYYIIAEYNYKDWDINVSEANKMPQDW